MMLDKDANGRHISRFAARHGDTCQKGIADIASNETQTRQREYTHGDRLAAYGRLIRVENCFLAAALTVIGGETARSVSGIATVRMLLAATIVWLVVASGNAVNDYLDRNIDHLRRPRRPLPSGLLSPGTALALAFLAGGLSVLLSVPLGLTAAVFVASMVALAFLYSAILKGVPLVGN